MDHYDEARRHLNDADAQITPLVQAILYVGSQLEVVAGLLGEAQAEVVDRGLGEGLVREEAGLSPRLTDAHRTAIRHAIELCEGLAQDGRDVYRNVPVTQVAETLRGIK